MSNISRAGVGKADILVRNSGFKWVILLIATLAQASACFFVQGLGAIAAFIQDDLQLSALQIGLLMSAAQLLPLAGLIVAGELLDRFGERFVVGCGGLLVGLALSSAMFVHGYLPILGVLLIVGAVYSTAQPGGSKAVSSWFSSRQRGLAMGIRQAGLPLGGALSAAILPYVALAWGWQAAFLVGGAAAALGALIFITVYRDPPDKVSTAAPGRKFALREELSARLAMLREPAMKNIVLSGVSLVSIQYGFLMFAVLHLHDTIGLPVTQAASLLFLAQMAGAVGRVLLAAWSDHSRGGRYLPVLISLVAILPGLLVLAWMPVHAPLLLGALMVWLGFFGFGWYGPWVTYVAEAAPVGKTGFALGLAMAVNQIAIVLVPPALGALKDLTRSYLPGFGILIAMGVGALLLTRQSACSAMRQNPELP